MEGIPELVVPFRTVVLQAGLDLDDFCGLRLEPPPVLLVVLSMASCFGTMADKSDAFCCRVCTSLQGLRRCDDAANSGSAIRVTTSISL